MKVLVTGATGFVGRHTVRELLSQGHAVTALARSAERASRHLPSPGGQLRIEYGDLLAPASLAAAAEGAEGVIHLVGIIHERGDATYERVHTEGTRNLLVAAREAGVARIVFVSSFHVSPAGPSRYQKTKHECEELLRASGIPYTILRPSSIYGPGDDFLNVIRDLYRRPVVPILGDGSVRRQPVFVGDLAKILVSSLRLDAARNRTFLVGGPRPLTYNEMLALVEGQIGKRRPKLRVPLGLVHALTAAMERVGLRPTVNRDMLVQYPEDDVFDPGELSGTFQIRLTPLEEGIRLTL